MYEQVLEQNSIFIKKLLLGYDKNYYENIYLHNICIDQVT